MAITVYCLVIIETTSTVRGQSRESIGLPKEPPGGMLRTTRLSPENLEEIAGRDAAEASLPYVIIVDYLINEQATWKARRGLQESSGLSDYPAGEGHQPENSTPADGKEGVRGPRTCGSLPSGANLSKLPHTK